MMKKIGILILTIGLSACFGESGIPEGQYDTIDGKQSLTFYEGGKGIYLNRYGENPMTYELMGEDRLVIKAFDKDWMGSFTYSDEVLVTRGFDEGAIGVALNGTWRTGKAQETASRKIIECKFNHSMDRQKQKVCIDALE